MELKPGYKRTEMGAIPDEWELAKLGTRASFRTGPFGSALHKSDYTEGGVPVINPMHIVDSRLLPTRTMTLTEAAARRLPEFRLKSGDVVIGRRGDMGRCAVVEEAQSGWLCGTGSMIIRCGQGVSPEFLQRILSSPRAIAAIEDASVGSTMINLNQGVLAGLMIQLPPPVEQSAITAALGDVDALIGALEKLIAKKRDLKQAAMLQLLTPPSSGQAGQRRLPGFHGVWGAKRFGELFQFLNTANNPRADLSAFGDVGYIHYGDIHANTAAFLNCSEVSLPLIARERVAGIPFVEDGDLVMVDASEDYVGVGKCVEVQNVRGREIVAGLHTFLLRGIKVLLADGFKGYLQSIPSVKAALIRFATGISVYGISKNNVRNVEILLPAPDEQTAIAAVLSDMDAEIAAVEQRRDKTRVLKQGMMQELLTGRTRLV